MEEVVSGVIILQTSSRWRNLCQLALAQSELALPAESVVICDSLDLAKTYIRSDQDQLFITGSIGGKMAPVERMIFRMRQINPQLKTACFTERRGWRADRYYFDAILPKGKFREGRLSLCDPIIDGIKHHYGIS